MQLLTKEFLSKYEGVKPPFTEIGEFVYYRTYSRWLENEGRRENWAETCKRAVEYNVGLTLRQSKIYSIEHLRAEAEKLFDNIFNLRQFLSGRTLWVGGTPVAELYPTSNFNCAFTVAEDFVDFGEIFYLLMVGTGIGVRLLKEDVKKFSKHRKDVELICKPYIPKKKSGRIELTEFEVMQDVALIKIGDSKEGWVEALNLYFSMLSSHIYKKIKTIIVEFDNIRPKGERLMTFGGTSSGHESMVNMFKAIHKILVNCPENKVRPIDCLDIVNHIGENVVVGGVRRTAEIVLSDDMEVIWAKKGIYTFDAEGNWFENKDLLHRRMSNNSAFFESKPSREFLHELMVSIKETGEPGFINAESARKRREDFEGVNPCGEILLRRKQLCNLVTCNVLAFYKDGYFDIKGLFEAVELGARSALRMTLVELELSKWAEAQEEDRLVGCSLTGWYDLIDALGFNKIQERALLRELKASVKGEVEKLANDLGINVPLLATTVKPEGTLSTLPTVSSGLHLSHSPYYIRRVRINSHDALCKVAEELGWIVKPEVGQEWETCNTKVVEFPVKSEIKRTKYDISAIEQLENYKMFMDEYVEHNASITVTVREHEWAGVEEWLWDNWDSVIGVTFLALDETVYPLAPYEAITKEEYEQRKAEIKPFDATLLTKYENVATEFEILDNECSGGACPLR